MTTTLRIVLLLVSLLTAGWIASKIHKSKMRIEDAVFWLLFAISLVLMALFPSAVAWLSTITGVMAPVNFVFLAIIFLLMVKLFSLSLKVSELQSKITALTQKIALNGANLGKTSDKTECNWNDCRNMDVS